MKATSVRLAACLVSLSLSLVAHEARADGARSFKSGTVQITADGRFVWAVNTDVGTISRFDTMASTVREFNVPACEPRGLAVKEDGSEVFVTCGPADAVVVLDGEGSTLRRIATGTGSCPQFVALSPDQSRAIVTLHRGDAVAIVSGFDSDAVTRLPTWRAPLGVAWSHDGRSAWVTHAFSDGNRTFVTRIDGPDDAPPSVGACVPIGEQLPLQTTVLPDGSRDYAEGGAVTLRGHLAQFPGTAPSDDFWLPAQHSSTKDRVPSMESTIQAAIHRLEPLSASVPPERRLVLSAMNVHDPTGEETWSRAGWNAQVAGFVDIAFSADGTTAWLACENSEDVLEIPTGIGPWRASATPPERIAVGQQPTGIAASPTSDRLYVLNSLDRTLSVIDSARSVQLERIDLTVETSEPLTTQLRLGRRIFHTSALPQASGNRKVSCASCHFNGEHDGLIWHFETLSTPLGPRPTTSMLGLSRTFGPRDPTTGLGQLHRAGDRDEIQDFEHTFRGQQMGGTGFFVAPPNGYDGLPNEGHSPEVDAMAAYMLSLEAPPRSPYRQADGTLTPAAKRGALIFQGTTGAAGDAGCTPCHAPATAFADKRFHDVGSARLPEERQINSRAPGWEVNTPSLVGLWSSAPYDDAGKDGEQVQDLVDVLRGFGVRAPGQAAHGNVSGLSARQLEDLAEFVLSIDGGMLATEAQAARDTQPPRLERVAPVSLTRIDCWFSEAVTAAAGNTGLWSVTADDGTTIRVVDARWDSAWGDRVTLITDPMPRDCRGRVITVTPGPIADAAGLGSVQSSNLLNVANPDNVHSFTLGDTLTITFGMSGRENEVVEVHDASLAGPEIPDASYDEAWMRRVAGRISSRAFVRFEWEQAFRDATGVTDPAEIVDASIALQPEWGAAQAVLARRMLQQWSDGRAGDDDAAAIGPPTWNEHGRGLGAWNAPGGRALGSSGRAVADYFGAYDVASVTDATVAIRALDQPAVLGGPNVADAFRFWFENPSLDMGYALELGGGTASELRMRRAGPAFGAGAPVLSITYRLPAAGAEPAPEVSPDGSDRPLLVRRDPAGVVVSFGDDASSAGYEVFEGSLGAFRSHVGLGCASPAGDGAGRMSAVIVPAPGDRYFLVGASSPCGGSLGTDSLGATRALRLSACTR